MVYGASGSRRKVIGLVTDLSHTDPTLKSLKSEVGA